MDYPEDWKVPMNPDEQQHEAPSSDQQRPQPGDRFVGALEKMTRESYACLAEADRMRRIGAIERRLSALEYALTRQERQQ